LDAKTPPHPLKVSGSSSDCLYLDFEHNAEVNVMTTFSGSCQCGAIRFQIEGKPKWVAHCHCADCRRATGAAASTYVGSEREQAKFLAGTPKAYHSSKGVRRTFCGDCGSPIAYEGERWPSEIHFFVGLFERADDLVPQVQVYEAEKMPWLHIVAEDPGEKTG
jgi:hypothetical protein